MDIYEKTLDKLKAEYQAGATFNQIAAKYGISHPYIYELIRGKKDIKKLSLDYFFRIMPEIKRQLDDGGSNTTNTAIAAGDNAAPSDDANKLALLRQAVALDICPECKNKVMALLVK